MSVAGAALIWCPIGSEGEARELAAAMVGEGLVACANIVPQLTSVFRWQDKIETATEAGVLFKTRTDLLQRATERLAQLHPYDTPAIVGWKADAVPPVTLEWLATQL